MAGPVELALVWYQPLVLHPGFLIAPPVFLVSPALSCQETVLSAHQACAQPPRSDTFVTFEFAFAFAHFHLLRLALRESPSAQCFAIGAQRQCLHDQHRVDLVALPGNFPDFGCAKRALVLCGLHFREFVLVVVPSFPALWGAEALPAFHWLYKFSW